MTTKDEALRMAIDAMESAFKPVDKYGSKLISTIAVCKSALSSENCNYGNGHDELLVCPDCDGTGVKKPCDHEWVSAKNSHVENGSLCIKCHAISSLEPSELQC